MQFLLQNELCKSFVRYLISYGYISLNKFGIYNNTNPIINYLLRAWIFPSWDDWLVMIVIGLVCGLGTFFLSQAYRISKAGEVAPFEYLALPISILWSITLFGDLPDFVSWVGIFLITGSGLYKALREIERVGKKKYVMVEGYRSEKELFNLQCWALTCESFFSTEEWLWLYKSFNYKGDYEFIFFE